MTPQERLGKRLFIVLATLLILQQLGTVDRSFYGSLREVNWTGLPSVETALSVLPHLFRHWVVQLVLFVSTLFLWSGHTRLRLFVGGAYVLGGVVTILAGVQDLLAIGVVFIFGVESTLILDGVAGLVHLLAGTAILLLPSLRAFFRYQRQGTVVAREDAMFSTPPRRGFGYLVIAAVWGLALGSASVFLVAAYDSYTFLVQFFFGGLILGVLHEVGAGFGELWGEQLGNNVIGVVLAAVSMGGLVGFVAGLAVGVVQPSAKQSALRLVFTRGLVAAAACVTATVLASVAWAAMWGPRAWSFHEGGEFAGLLQGTPQVAVMGFVLGGAIALLVNDSEL